MASVLEKAGCAAFMVVLITSAFLLGFSFYVGEYMKLMLCDAFGGKLGTTFTTMCDLYGLPLLFDAWGPWWEVGEARE